MNFTTQMEFKRLNEFVSFDGWLNFTEISRIFNDSIPGLIRHNRGDWVDVYRNDSSYHPWDAKLSFSICFPAVNSRYFNISASSTVPIVQPRYRYDPNDQRIRFDDVRKQLLTSSKYTPEQRGILSLDLGKILNSDRLPGYGGLPKVPYLDFSNTDKSFDIEPKNGLRIMHFMNNLQFPGVRADVSIGGLFLEILRTGGTTAEAVQGMIMALTASRYQDYIFIEGGNGSTERQIKTQRADFAPVQIPGGRGDGQLANQPASATWSYCLIMTAVFLHCAVVCISVVWFCRGMSPDTVFACVC
jgi:hypothetical protein